MRGIIHDIKKQKVRRKKKTVKTADVVIVVLMGIFCFVMLYPMWYVLVGSFNQGLDYSYGNVYFWPRVWTLDNYRIVIEDMRIWRAYLVTILRTTIATGISLIYTTIVAYAMSRPRLKFRKFFYRFMMVTMFFGGGMIPYYMLLKSLGLLNSFWVYVIPSLFSVYNMIIMSNFFSQLPDSVIESAVVDGAGEYRIVFSIVLPLSKPVLATVALWGIVGHWNSYFESMYYVTDSKLYTLQYVLMRIIDSTSMPSSANSSLPMSVWETVSSKTVSFAAIIISVLPVLFVYPFLHKHYAGGVTLGAEKG